MLRNYIFVDRSKALSPVEIYNKIELKTGDKVEITTFARTEQDKKIKEIKRKAIVLKRHNYFIQFLVSNGKGQTYKECINNTDIIQEDGIHVIKIEKGIKK